MEKEVDLEIDYKGIGKRIKAARKKKGLSQKSLAILADIGATNISHIERGATKASLPTLIKIANSLGVSMDELMCDSLTSSKHISQSEIADIIDKCSPREARIIAATVSAMFGEIHGKID